MALGYSVSSSTMFPSIRFAARLVTDPLNKLEPENNIFTGLGAQTASGNDWGNATSMSVDPIDDCTFYYTNEWMKATGTAWATRISSFRVSSCN
jgi:hypothetical protein